MAKNMIVVTHVEENPEVTLEEVCELFHIPVEFVYEIIEQGVVEPVEPDAELLRFDETHLKRIKTIAHLHHDLDINVAGGALIVEMMEEMEAMRARLELFEKYFSQMR